MSENDNLFINNEDAGKNEGGENSGRNSTAEEISVEAENREPQDQTAADGGQPIPILSRFSAEKERRKRMKTIIIVLVIVIIVLAVVIAALKISKKKRSGEEGSTAGTVTDEDGEESGSSNSSAAISDDGTFSVEFESDGTDYSEQLSSHSDVVTNVASTHSSVSETKASSGGKQTGGSSTSTYKEKETVITNEKTTGSSEEKKQIKSFFNKKFYLKGVMISDGEAQDVEMAMNGDNVEVYSDMDGIKIGIFIQDGKTYLKNPETKKYMLLSKATMKMMGVNADELTFDLGDVSFDADKPSSVTKATYNGQDAVSYTYNNDGEKASFVFVSGKLKEISLSSGSKLQCEKFSSSIPSNMLTLDGFEKQNMMSFMADFS